MSIREALAETWQEQGFKGVLIHLYGMAIYLSGFHEWLDARAVRRYRMPSGMTLAAELPLRLRSNGLNFPIRWHAVCYGPSANVFAYLGEGEACSVAFKYYSPREVFVLNPVATQLFPDLSKPEPPISYPINRISLKDLGLILPKD